MSRTRLALRLATRTASLPLLAAIPLILAGCGHDKPAPAKPPVQRSAESPLPDETTQGRANELEARLNDLTGTAKALPGRTDTEHRRLMARAFGDLQRILPLLNLDNADAGAFQQELSILRSSQRQLQSRSSNTLSEPPINTGLRAAAHALTSLANSLDLPDREAALKQLATNLNALDTEHGPMHRLAATRTVDTQATLAARLAKVVADRIGLELQLRQAAASQPASRPAAPAATLPAIIEPENHTPVPATAAQPPALPTPATLPATQLLPTTVPAEPLAPPAQAPAPQATTKTTTPPPIPMRDLNKE